MATDLFGHRSLIDTGLRSSFDWYPTPSWATRSLLFYMPEIAEPGTVVLECASGDDAIAAVLRDEFGCNVITNDLDPTQPAQRHLDATVAESWPRMLADACLYECDYVITNPPFNLAFDMLRHAVDHAVIGVAFLLRKTFLEPTEERGEWLFKHPPSRVIGLPRHSFRGEGSDSVACDWMIWEKHPNRSAFPIKIDYLAKTRTSRGAV